MRFLADENVSCPVVDRLRAAGLVRGVILLELDRLPSAAEAELVAQVVRIHGSKLTGNLLVVEPARIRVRPCHGKLENSLPSSRSL